MPYLASVAAGREDKTLRNTLSQVLGSLNSASFLNNKVDYEIDIYFLSVITNTFQCSVLEKFCVMTKNDIFF